MTADLSELRWRKASASGGEGTQCVEVAWNGSASATRDSKNPAGGMLAVDVPALVAAVKDGRLFR